MEDLLNNQPVGKITVGNTDITILGTAHVSRQSAETVAELVDSGQFDSVAIELCESRHRAIQDPESMAKMDLFKVIKDGKAPMVMASLALSAFQQRLADQFGIQPGQEMRVASERADTHNLPLHLIDREIGATLKRVYKSVPWWQRLGIFSGLIASVISREEIDEKDIEKLKEGDMLESTFQEFAENSEHIYRPLIDERDRYMANKLYTIAHEEQPKSLLAVVGAGHLKGMETYLNSYVEKARETTEVATETTDLEFVPARSKLWMILPWFIVLIIFGGFALGFSRSEELGWSLIKDWVLINGGLSALGAIFALAHPLTIIGAFIAAPLTSLNPTIGAGMVTGAMEAYVRKPQVGDFSNLRQDTADWRGWWRNRVSKVLLVFFFCTVGSAAGTYIAGYKIFDKLF